MLSAAIICAQSSHNNHHRHHLDSIYTCYSYHFRTTYVQYKIVTRLTSPTNFSQNMKTKKRCLGLEVPHRALVVAARMLQHALSVQDEEAKVQPLTAGVAANTATTTATAAAGVIVELSSSEKPAKSAGPAAIGGGGKVGDDRREKKKARGGPPPPPVSREEFGRIVGLCLLPYSLTWTDAIYGVCLGEGGVEGEEAAVTSGGGGVGDSGKAKKKGKVAKVGFAGYILVCSLGCPRVTYPVISYPGVNTQV